MYTLRVPASFDDTINFLLKSYAQPLVSIYGSDMSDWVAERDFIIRVATSSVREHDWPKWFLAVPMPQANVMSKADFGDAERLKGRYVAFHDGKIIAAAGEPYLVMEEAVMHQWDSIVNLDTDDEATATAEREDIEKLVSVLKGIVLCRVK
jgi:hypothetical protein